MLVCMGLSKLVLVFLLERVIVRVMRLGIVRRWMEFWLLLVSLWYIGMSLDMMMLCWLEVLEMILVRGYIELVKWIVEEEGKFYVKGFCSSFLNYRSIVVIKCVKKFFYFFLRR